MGKPASVGRARSRPTPDSRALVEAGTRAWRTLPGSEQHSAERDRIPGETVAEEVNRGEEPHRAAAAAKDDRAPVVELAGEVLLETTVLLATC